MNLYDIYEVYFYILQQNLYRLLILNISQFNIYVCILMFLFGLITSLSPCFLSIMPLSIAYMNSSKYSKKNNLLFTLGIANTIFFFSLIINFINIKYFSHIYKVPIFSSIILLIISLNLLQIFNFYV
uniref:Thiol:disulfide interchange protein n=1 Tax=Compsothamnion thuioides TaxID=3097386 RepID=A0A4D6WNQ3_9FLOR|nr:Thiol:disulfide interchange protein [Compsothamnion thuyoides]